MKKKKLLVTTVSYLPYVGGTELILHKTLLNLRDIFEEITVFSGLINTDYELDGIKVRQYNRYKVIKWAIINRPDWYYANLSNSLQTRQCLSIVSKLAKKTVVNMVGGHISDLNSRCELLEMINMHSDYIIETDKLNLDAYIDSLVIDERKIKYISQGINYLELDNVDCKNRNYFLFAHNLWPWKRPEIFINMIVKKLPSYKFKIIASDKTGTEMSKILKIAANYSNLKVKLGLDRRKFLAEIGGASAIISTSEVEGSQSNLLLEAGYLGIPYISLFPRQFISQYPHVEMYENIEEIRNRLIDRGYRIKDDKVDSLKLSRHIISGKRFHWDNIIKQYIELFSN